MKKPFFVFAALLLAGLVLLSCSSKSEEDVTYSDKCYISSFVLGQLTRTVHTKDISGNDSTYKLSFYGSSYKMLIDQRQQIITNRDSLPQYTNVSAVLATITGSGTITYATSSDATEWTKFSESDSIDFSRPLVFRVTAPDGENYRDYKLKVNVRQARPDDYTWSRMTDVRSTNGTLDNCQLLFVDHKPLIFTSEGSTGKVYVTKGTASIPVEWTEQECTGLGTAPVVGSAQYFDGKFWMSCDQSLYTSTDAVTWEQVIATDGTQIIRLVAASETALYASIAGTAGVAAMARSFDGLTWTPMSVEGGGFTGQPYAALAYQQDNGNHRVVMVDNVTDGAAPLSVWNLLENSNEGWVLFAQAGDNNYLLPACEHLDIFVYDKCLFAVGGKRLQSDITNALSKAFVSFDNGITWLEDENFVPPTQVQGTTGAVAAATEGEYIWIVAGSQVWRARLNSYGE